MGLLLIFALLAGAGTAVSPCVLPVLPALLSAGATGGRRRPIGIVLGLAVTFTVTVAVLANVVSGVGLGDTALRDLAIVVLLVFGVALAVPSLAARVEAPLSRLARFGPKDTGDGFTSGLAVGAALGFVYTPCAGPILAAVISVGATTGTTLRTLLVALAYAAGSAIVLLVLMLGGRRLIPRTAAVQQVLGAILIVTAVAMIARVDVRAEKAIAEHAPNANLAAGLEDSAGVGRRLDRLRPRARFAERTAGPRSRLPVLGTAPDFTGTQRWFNSRPLSLAALQGRVVLVDFWTYTCINCIRTLPYLKAWDARYRRAGLTIVGVHSPEFSFEKDAGNVADAIRQFGIRYPVVQDNDLATWQAWGNQYWPAEYLIDAQGKVRHVHFGEGDYAQSEAAIRSLLAERDGRLGGMARPRDPFTISAQATPETYLGSARAERWVPAARDGTRTYAPPRQLALSHFALGGVWRITPEEATAVRDATLTAHVLARHVYLVLGGRGDVGVTVDGRRTRTVHVTHQRLYTLADFPRAGDHTIGLTVAPGVSGFAFTFG